MDGWMAVLDVRVRDIMIERVSEWSHIYTIGRSLLIEGLLRETNGRSNRCINMYYFSSIRLDQLSLNITCYYGYAYILTTQCFYFKL